MQAGNIREFARLGFLLRTSVICVCAALFGEAFADTDFEEIFLHRGNGGVSPDVFIWRDAVSPGIKFVDVKVNDRFADSMDVMFVSDGKNSAAPCLTREQLIEIGVKADLYDIPKSGAGDVKAAPSDCTGALKKIPSSQIAYDATQQVVSVTVPQEAVDRKRYTMISPNEWDHGVPSLRTSYNGYFYSSKMKGQSGNGWRTSDSTSESAYVNFNSTGTLGAWRFYSLDSFYRNPEQGWKSNHDRAYLSRDIAALRSNLQAGEIYTNTSGYMNNALPLTGVSLGTQQNISLENEFSYAPVVRGTARTNARLVIRQSGNIIYSTTLTPGPFAIDDLYSARVGADLEVTVEESDGQVQVFHVPYTVLPSMIRPGSSRYNIAAGKYRTQRHGDNSEPWVMAGNVEYGFERFTLNNMLMVSEDYQSLSTGAAWNIGNIGAFSTEIAHARYQDKAEHKDREGTAVRFLYARHFEVTGTSLQILGYQYRSKNYLTFPEFAENRNDTYTDRYAFSDDQTRLRRRNRVEMNLNQSLHGYGSLYLNMSQDRFYGTDHKATSVSGGLGTTVKQANISLSLTRMDNGRYGRADNQLGLYVSLPLGSTGSNNYGSLSYGLNRDGDNHYSQTLGYSGNAMDNRINYSITAARSAQGDNSQSGTLGYNGSLANISGGYSRGSNYNQYSAGISGGVTLYGGGVVLSPQLGNTVAIVETPGASGIGISGGGSTKTDYFGRAVLTSLTPYRYNDISLDPGKGSASQNIEIKETSRRVVPSNGAAVLLKFATRVGRRALVVVNSDKKIPVGAMAYVGDEKEEAGIVGNNGEIYLSGLDARHTQNLKVVWGEKSSEQCSFSLPALPEGKQSADDWYKKVTATCV
ncbi:fimbria/pilus outer membrane usher protein [Enterobacter sp. KE9933]|uniref:fimbria/pilus outer membrane usher protein n=1 Tax=Enterobacter sp. KE9933 TaxID=3118153 RepID=UPI00374FEAE1